MGAGGFLQVLLGGLEGGANQVLEDRDNKRKLAEQIQLDKVKQQQAMENNLIQTMVQKGALNKFKDDPVNFGTTAIPKLDSPESQWILSLLNGNNGGSGKNGGSHGFGMGNGMSGGMGGNARPVFVAPQSKEWGSNF